MADTQTRQEHYDDCKAKGDPLPEIINAETIAYYIAGAPVMAKKEDQNASDYRVKDAGGAWGPWLRAQS